MSTLLTAELAAACNALGTLDKRNGKYLIDDYTLDTVKDLIRYLRRDDEDHEIRRHLGQTQVLQTDLVHILINHWEKPELFDVTLRLVVNLTNPPLLLYREEIPTEKTGRRCYLQMTAHLAAYKAVFAGPDIWTVLAKRLTQILEIDVSERGEDNGLIIERILILVRNILHVPADDHEKRRPDNDASVHDQVLWALNQSGLMDILLYMASESEKVYFMHILEIISLALREQNPTTLSDAALQRSMDEKIRDEQELLTIRASEMKEKMAKIRNYTANRHSRFGGTFVVQNMKSISDNDIICHKPLNSITKLDFGLHKGRVKKPKNRRPNEDITSSERRSAFAVRLFLKEFCIEFLNASYNTMMYHVREVLVRSKGQKNDESYYMWALRFFMEFNRNYNFQVKLVSETMSIQAFYFVQRQMENCFDMITMEKNNCSPWVRRLHLSLKAYHELLQTMLCMDKCEDQSVKDSSIVIKSNIFYILEYREFILHLFLSYDENKMPKTYLKDVIETSHIFLKMLEQYCKRHGLIVQKKIRSKAKKSKNKKPKAANPAVIDKEAHWEDVASQLSAVLQSDAEISTDIIPFDATLDTPIEEQKGDCMRKIQKLLSEHRYEDAIGLIRAGREVWPENDIFGSNSMPVDEEFSVMKMIFMANIGAEAIELPPQQGDEKSDNEVEDNEDDEDRGPVICEADFSFDDFFNRFANPKVIKSCCLLLQTFDKNSTYTNHCIIKMLHRIAWDCKYYSMLFQASVFQTFQKILASDIPHFKELQKFAIFITRKFTEIAQKNPKVFMEILFWKNTQEAYELENDYASLDNDHKTKAAWTEEQEDELRKLYLENQTNPTNDMDVIDWLVENLVDKTRTRRNVVKKLKELGLIFKLPTRKNTAMRPLKNFSEEDDEQLRTLWKKHCKDKDPMGEVLERLAPKRPKQRVIDRLLELGLVADRKECFKKRHKSDYQSNNSGSDDSVSSDSHKTSMKKKANPQKKRRQSNHKNNKSKVPEKSNVSITKALITAVDAGLTDALKWIMESLEEVALDQEAEGQDAGTDAVPIVPVVQECVEAMENPIFKECLQCLGIEPPANEQETYWRIPSHIHFDSLRKRCETITRAIEKTLILPEETSTQASIASQPAEDVGDVHYSSSSEEEVDDFFSRIKSMGQIAEDESNSKNISTQGTSNKKSNGDLKKPKIVKRKRSVSDGEDVSQTGSHKVAKKHQVLSSSDSEPENINENQMPKPKGDSSVSNELSNNDSNDSDVMTRKGVKNTSNKKTKKRQVKVFSDSESDLEPDENQLNTTDLPNENNFNNLNEFSKHINEDDKMSDHDHDEPAASSQQRKKRYTVSRLDSSDTDEEAKENSLSIANESSPSPSNASHNLASNTKKGRKSLAISDDSNDSVDIQTSTQMKNKSRGKLTSRYFEDSDNEAEVLSPIVSTVNNTDVDPFDVLLEEQ